MSGLFQRHLCAAVPLLVIGVSSCAGEQGTAPGTEMSGMNGQGSEGGGDPEPSLPNPVDVLLDDLNCAPTNPVPTQGRLLTRLQYRSTVLDLFGVNVDTTAFPRENEVLGFQTNATYHRATPLLAEAQMLAAEQVAEQVAVQVLEGTCAEATESCGLDYIREVSPQIFRRPLTLGESSPLETLFSEQFQASGFQGALSLVLEVLLQSPQFLYRLEFDGDPLPSSPGFELSGFEAASRLSYFLWNSAPDSELLEAASDSKLETLEQIEAQARRMLADPRAERTVDDFYEQWLGINRFNSVVRETPGFAEHELAPSWRKSLSAYLAHTFWEDGASFEGLMTSDVVFLDESLAKLYGASGAETDALVQTTLPKGQRSGLLTQPGLLSLLSHSDQSSPILRGVFVREEILCQPPPAPPPNVDQTVPDPDPNATTRERLRVHTGDPGCASCHSLIDPIGLGFEAYDHLGRHRELENGKPVDTSGDLVSVREDAIEGEFDGAIQLSERLAKSAQAKLCFVTQWYRYAAGRIEQDVDLCSIAQARRAFGPKGDMMELMVGLASTDAFRYRADTKLDVEAEQ